MFSGLFDEGENNAQGGSQHRFAKEIDTPHLPRKSHGLCGIFNQGATCFLNTLIQTLVMTPELRETLFNLDDTQLGSLEDKDKPGSKVRVIPIQLQKLFARLLLLNVEGVSTSDLTASFGWNSQDCFIQHDVQELNRILFSAIEDSLIGTCGERVIKDLYHGTIVNQIVCEECKRVSEREEEFLDLCVTVAGSDTLHTSLGAAYSSCEYLQGDNRYRCDGCRKLVNAKKGAKLRHLPPILSVSLLRFAFDFKKLERYKETGKFVFPQELDMSAYCENVTSPDLVQYELFSVVIHSGSTHGGHYHCYIRDVDGLGNWSKPEEEEIQIPVDPATGKVDFIEFDSPIELLQAILTKTPDRALPVDKLCSELTKQTGVSWNKRFKAKHGPINKFLKKYDDKFVLDPATHMVALKSYTSGNDNQQNNDATNGQHKPVTSQQQEENPKNEPNKEKRQRPQSPPPPPGSCWFDYNDSRIRPIRTKEIEKQFSGKESAYMLFYRRKSMIRHPDAYNNPLYNVPAHLVDDVLAENDRIEQERRDYELKVNSITVLVHFSQFYSHSRGGLDPLSPSCAFIEVQVDRRTTIADLRQAIQQVGGELMVENFVIHSAKQLPAGLHLYQCISDNLEKPIKDCGICHQDNLFVWDGKEVCGEALLTGSENEPILLNVTCPRGETMSWGFPKCISASGLIDFVNEKTGEDKARFQLCRLSSQGGTEEKVPLSIDDLERSISELNFRNGDTLICEELGASSQKSAETSPAFKHVKLLSVTVELRCQAPKEDGSQPVINIDIEKDISVCKLKRTVISQGHVTNLHEGGRLRVDDENLGLRSPLHEQQSLEEAGIKQGTRLVLEDGPAPKSNQITLNFTCEKSGKDVPYLDVLADRKLGVGQLLTSMLQKAGFQDDNWHLRKTNCFQEATEILDDPDLTLEECNLQDGDLVIIEEGRLPPKGFLRLAVALSPSPPVVSDDGSMQNVISWLADGVKALFTSVLSGDQSEQPVHLGEVMISKEATLDELKFQIMTLPALSSLSIPSANFLRVRILENGDMTTVLKGGSVILQRLKVTSSSQLGVQILQQDEQLGSQHLVLQVRERETKSRSYRPARELVWNTKHGATPLDLRRAIADLLALPVEYMAAYKHVRHKHEWMVISDNAQKGKQQAKQGRKGQKTQKTNVKNAPYSLKDGDIIGVKNLQLDPHNKDDMRTEADDEGKRRLQQQADDKKKQREEKRSSDDSGGVGSSVQWKRREERAIKIHVDNFT